MTVRLEQATEEIQSLQRCITDLVSALALPAMWTGCESSQIINTLLDALSSMLDLDFVYARLREPSGAPPIEMLRTAKLPALAAAPQEFGRLLHRCLGDDPHNWPPVVRSPIGEVDISMVPLRLGLRDEAGLIIAGSHRADFPRQTERLLLSVATNQAAIGLQEARLLSEQKRATDELDRRVVQRTRELAAANEELQLRVSMLQQLPVAAWTVKPDGTPDILNQRWFDYTGQTPAYINSAPEAWMAILHPDDRETAQEIYWEGMRSGHGFTLEARFLRAHDRTYRWHLSRAVALRDAGGLLLRFVGTSTDIEDLKQSQENLRRAAEQLRESELHLRQMTETIPEMLWSATAEGAIDYYNARVLDYTGFRADEIMGNCWTKLLHPGDVEQTARVWSSCVASGSPYRVEVRVFHAADRTYRWCVTSALPLPDRQGRILKWYGTVVDMHDWKQAQEELRNTQAELAHMGRVMTMGELTASIAHEVNQPLSGIITNASTCLRMLAADPPNVDGARETARRTIRDGKRASDVIVRLRAMFTKKEVAVEAVDLNEAAREVIALCSGDFQRERVLLRTELAEDLPSIQGDRVQLQQVILNLLANASDAMLNVEDRPRELLVRTAVEEGDLVRVTVRDTGVGFNPQDVDRLFAAFYSTKRGGMGIGLSVSRSIVETHQGRLWAASNDGPGATFSFCIPRASAALGAARVVCRHATST